MTALTIAALLINPTHLVSSVSCQPIPDRVAAHVAAGRTYPFEIHSTYELLSIPLDEVIAAGELAVEGTVHPLRTYMSDDRCRLFTDYAVTVSNVLHGALPKSTKPGAPALVVTTVGGEITVDGVRVLERQAQLPPFTAGQRVVLILARGLRDTQSTYMPVGGVYGAFAVENGRAKHMLQSGGSEKFEDMDKAALIARLKRQE